MIHNKLILSLKKIKKLSTLKLFNIKYIHSNIHIR